MSLSMYDREEQQRYPEEYVAADNLFLSSTQPILPPILQWPQMEQLYEFQMQPQFSTPAEFGFTQSAEPMGYPMSLPPQDIIDAYPALPAPSGNQYDEIVASPPMPPVPTLANVKVEEVPTGMMATEPLYEATPFYAPQYVQQQAPIISPQPLYPWQVPYGSLRDDYGGRSCMRRIRTPAPADAPEPAPKYSPLFTREELDEWGMLARAALHSFKNRQADVVVQVKQEHTSPPAVPTPTHPDGAEIPRGGASELKEGVARTPRPDSAQSQDTTPVKFLDAEYPPRKTPEASPKRPAQAQQHRRGGIAKEKPQKPPPFLACFFCRGRKIACTPPEPGNPDRTCNQCERRNLICEYPLVSRRGQRPLKGLNTAEEGPKVRYVPRRRSTLAQD